jgi:hypothetical protein
MSSNENSMEALEKEEKLARSKNHYQEIEEKVGTTHRISQW